MRYNDAFGDWHSAQVYYNYYYLSSIWHLILLLQTIVGSVNELIQTDQLHSIYSRLLALTLEALR